MACHECSSSLFPVQIEALRKEVAETEAELQRATRLLKLADPEGYFKDPGSHAARKAREQGLAREQQRRDAVATKRAEQLVSSALAFQAAEPFSRHPARSVQLVMLSPCVGCAFCGDIERQHREFSSPCISSSFNMLRSLTNWNTQPAGCRQAWFADV